MFRQWPAESLSLALAKPVSALCAPSMLNQPIDPPTGHVPPKPTLNFTAQVERGFWITWRHTPFVYIDNSAEYRRRYKHANPRLFAIECRFLDLTLRQCKNDNIPVIIVNMPLHNANMLLMPKGSYREYLIMLKNAAQIQLHFPG